MTKSRFIMFVDGDSIIARGWIKPALELMSKDPSIVMLGGALLPDSKKKSLPDVEEFGQ